MSRRSSGCAVLGLVVCLCLLAGCSSAGRVTESAPPPPDPNQERVVYVALGGSETLNRQLDDPLRDAWTQRVFMTALPRSAVHVNFAGRDATVREGLTEQLAGALELQPTIATLWFGSGDDLVRTSDAAFERDLTQLVTELEAAGARVLLLSPADAGVSGFGRYARTIEAVANTAGAQLVAVPPGDLGSGTTQTAIAAAVTSHLGP